jgi:hypothetical protein
MRAFPLVLIAALAVPTAALGQDSQGRQRVPPKAESTSDAPARDGASQAVPRNDPPPQQPRASAPPPAPAPAPARRAVERTPPPAPAAAPADTSRPQGRQRIPPEARRDQPRTAPPDRSGGVAVPRPPNQPPRVGDDRDRGRGRDTYIYAPGGRYYGGRYYYYDPYYYPRRSYPYGYGAFGLGYFYYDPYTWGPAYGYSYPEFRGYGYGYATGELRLQVRPRDADVYVDGYFAGRVDDFDGTFQSLTLEEGAYRIEIVAPGYAPLVFDVRILPGEKVTYRGELVRGRP